MKEYYTIRLEPALETEVFEKYTKIVKNEFFPDRGFGKLRYSIVNKVISDFKFEEVLVLEAIYNEFDKC